MTLTDQRMERILANLLRTSVLLSAAVVAAGGGCYLVQHRLEPVSYRHFQPALYRNVSGVADGVAHGNCLAVIQLGLLLLIATPVARVAASVIAFAVEKDRTYVAVSLIVFLILMYSLWFMH